MKILITIILGGLLSSCSTVKSILSPSSSLEAAHNAIMNRPTNEYDILRLKIMERMAQ